MPRFPKLLLVSLCLLLFAAGTFAAPANIPDRGRVSSQARWWDQLQEADVLANQGDWPMATVRLQELLVQVPPPVQAMIHLRLASIFANQKDWARAIANGKQAIEVSPSNGWIYLPVAKIMVSAGRTEEAIALCREAMANDPAVRQAARDLIREFKNQNPLRKYALFWVLLSLGMLGGSVLFYVFRKPKPAQVPAPLPPSEHSLPNYYPLTERSYSPGDMVGHYKILSTVGNTLHSILYCALDTHLDRQVALKQVNPGVGGDAPIKRFQKEVKSLIALSNHHAGVVRVYDFIEPGMLVMEWVDGRTLEEAHLEADRLLEIGIELCNILAFAHSMGIIHRDIKPSNIMLTSQTQQVRLLDFGIAKNAGLGTSNLTIDGSVPIGTFTYMAPEQFSAPNQAQPAADVYSLGLTLYRLLTGHLPTDPWFGPRTFSLTPETEFAPITTECPAIQRYLETHPVETDWVQELDEAIRKAFRERPKDRYENADEFGARLKGIWHRIANLPHTGDLKRS